MQNCARIISECKNCAGVSKRWGNSRAIGRGRWGGTAMEDETTFGSVQERTSAGWGLLARILNSRFTRAFENTSAPFEICLPDQSVHRFGRTAPCFRFVLKNRSAVWALASLDAGRFADARSEEHTSELQSPM